jgi:allene oxide cyclase
MRILMVVGGIAAAIVVVAATALAAGAGGTAKTIHVIEHATTDAVTETGKKGDSAGDLLTFANALYNTSNTTSVGSDDGWCIRTAAGKSWECAWTSMLAGGQIMVSGPFLDAGPSKLAIVGGTGTYAGARGWMDLRSRNKKGTEYDFVFHLS